MKLLIEKGADVWNRGLYGACYGGHLETAQLMIANGANNFNVNLFKGCQNKDERIVNLLITYGATSCFCWKSMDKH